MGRGVSSGGGQSSLGYLFGSADTASKAPQRVEQAVAAEPAQAVAPPAPAQEGTKQIPAGVAVAGSKTNNYFRADGQNTGNFLTVWSFTTFSSVELFNELHVQ
ncbi:Protein SPIRAL1-like 2 [Linum perenne]